MIKALLMIALAYILTGLVLAYEFIGLANLLTKAMGGK